MALSQLENSQRKEYTRFLNEILREGEPQQFDGIDPEYTFCNLVEPGYFGDFPEEGHIVLAVHGNMADPDFFEPLGERLESSEKPLKMYGIDTSDAAPRATGFAEELEEAYSCLEEREDFDSLSVVAHSLGCVGALKWAEEYGRTDEIDRFVAAAGPYGGTAAADMGRLMDGYVSGMESMTRLWTAFNPLADAAVENFYDRFKIGDVADEFVSVKSAEEGELAELMAETTITEDAEVYTLTSGMDRWFGPLEHVVPAPMEPWAHATPYENDMDSPKIEGAEENFFLPGSTHNEAIKGDIAVEYIGRVLEGYDRE